MATSTAPPPPPRFLFVELKKKAPPPSEEPPPASESPPPPPPPPDESPPPPPDESSPPPSEKSPPPPDATAPPPASSSPPPPPPPEGTPPPPPPENSSPPPASDKSPPPPSPKAPPPDFPSPPPPPSAPPPTNVTPPPPPDQDSSPPPPPPHHKHSPPPSASPPAPNNDTPPPPNYQSPPPNNATPPPPPAPPTDQPPPPGFATSPPPPPQATPPLNAPPPTPIIAPPPSNNSALTPPPHPQPSPASPPSNSSTKGTPAASPLPVSTKKTVTETPSTKSQADGAHTVFVASFVGFCALSLLVLAVWFVSKRRRRTKQRGLDIYKLPSQFSSSHNSESSFLKPPRPLNDSQSQSGSEFMFPDEPGSATSGSGGNNSGMGSSRSWFTYQELSDATDRFSSQNLLGEGGFGCVYKGRLSDGKIVAVKQLKVGSGQGEREFRAEVDIISRIHHRHLVSLVGYCISDRQRLLVYEYIANDTLENHLHAQAGPVLSWANRVKIAIGSARGLAYLHEDCHPRIIHRDIKSANILLDENFESRVADFGLARLASDTYTHVSTRVMGTFGYMAPEYASSGKLTEKSDVYSFGVVLLELITGRKPVDLSQDESLVEWARPLLVQALETENFTELADPRLQNNYIDAEMFRMIEAAGACVRHSASKRPKMGQVVRAFDSMGELADLTNGVKPGQSGIFNTAEQSAQMRMFQKMAFGSQEYSNGFFNETQSSWSSGSNSLASRAGGPRL